MAFDPLLTRRSATGLLLTGAGGLLVPHVFAQSGPPGGPRGMRGPPPPQAPYVFESAQGPTGRCILIPDETAGPYPVDLFNNGKMLRSDIREDRAGTPLDLELDIVDVRNGCAPVQDARVDLWQCDKEGTYSGVQNLALVPGARHDDTRGKTFLRGIQRTDAQGRVRFRTIFPGWYPSRLTHIHFQVRLPDGRVVTSQVAFDEALTHEVYRTPLYRDHGQNTSVASLAADNVFGDDHGKYQLVKLTGDARTGLRGALPVAIIASRPTGKA